MRRLSTSVLVLLLVIACQDEPSSWKDDYTFVWHGEYVSVYGYERSVEEACGGSFAAIDMHTASILESFGTHEPIHYEYRWMSPEFFQGRCKPGAAACTAYGEPWTESVPQMHEISHATLYASWDNACPSFLDEGLAEYFSSPRWSGDKLPEPSTVGDILTGAPIQSSEYSVAGHFASFLMEEFGSEAVKELCYAIPFNNTMMDWDQAAEEVLGLSLPELLALYETYPLCTQQQYRARVWECAGQPDVTYTGEELTFYVDSECESERVLGPVSDKAIAVRRVWFTEDITAQIVVLQQDPPGQLDLFMTQECAPCSAGPQVYRTDGLPPIYPFRAGMHEFIFAFELDATGPLEVYIGPP